MSVPTNIRTNLLETAVVVAAIRWHTARDIASPSPRHADPQDEYEAACEDEQSAARLHEAVAALVAAYDRQDETRQTA